jgi:hypothetical protein
MIKISLMISHMSVMTNGWYLPHHVLNDYCPKQFVHNDSRAISHFGPLYYNINHKLSHVFEDFY